MAKVKKIRKRDGTLADFDPAKITQAIFKALTAADQGDGKLSKNVCDRVVKILNRRFKEEEVPGVEQIQDIVEEVLILEDLIETARAYILYREQRRRIREAIKFSEEAVDRVDQYLEKLDWEVQENANMAFSLQGLNHYGVSYIVKRYWLNKIYPKGIREASASGDFHIHNLDTLGPYCSGWDLYDLLLRGFGGVRGKMESKPARHFRAALGQVVNFLFTLQGEVAGAVALSNFDTLLAPFIRYDNLDYGGVKQALQEFMFNMATPTRVGFQNPFSNITLDLRPAPVFAKQPVLIGGEPQKETYQEFEEEMKIFDRAFYEVMMEGDKSKRPFHFPIPTINITKDFPWQEPAFDGIFEASAKYGTNYFANYINSEMKPEDVRSMCVTPDTQIIYKNALGDIQKTPIRRVVEDFIKRGNSVKVLMNGKFVDITDVLRLPNKIGYVLKITLENGETFRITPDHPSMLIKKGRLIECKSEKLEPGDEIPVAKNFYKGELGDFGLGRFIGLYVAEGYLAHKGVTTAFCFNLKEKDYFDFVTKFTRERLGAKTTLILEKERQSLKAIINDRAVGALIKNYVRGDYSLNKRFNSKLFGMSFEFRKGVLLGILEGDGHISKKDITRNVQINSSNSGLIDDIGLLCRSLGVNYTKQVNLNNTHFGVKFTSYKLLLTNDFPEWIGRYFSRKIGKSRVYKDYKNFYGVKIKSIEKIVYNHQIYDLETKGREHLFQLANGVITHNCCRLRLNLTELRNRGGGGLFGSGALTGSVGVVTINLPRIGYLSKTKKEFFERLGKAMDLAQDSLEIKRKTIESFIEKGLYPYSKYYLQGVKKMRGSYYGNHFSTIGLVGMNECLLNFLGENTGSERGRKFTLEVLDFMREKLVKYQEETGNIYNLEQTPAESTAYRLALKDRKEYPDIVTAGTKEVPYYTNCVSEDTEILTDKGWRGIDEIAENEKALTYNVKKRILEYKRILHIYNYPKEKRKMIRIRHKYVDLLVTPNHFILYSPQGAPHKEVFTFANNLNKYFNLRVAAEYKYLENEKFSDNFLKLIGWIISEGHFERDNAGIRIYQSSNPGYILEIRNTLTNLGINFREWKDNVFTWGKEREETCFRIPAEIGRQIREVIDKKEIPREILNEISPRQAEVLLDAIIKGDGTRYRTYSVINTSNPKLANQLMELAIKAGHYIAVHDYRDKTGTFHVVISNMRRRLNKHQISRNKHVREVEYEGRVWCVETENKTIIVRRKIGGSYKFCITGNSTQLPVNYTDDIFEALNLQDDIQCKYSGGSVLHLFLGERISDIEAVKKLIKKVFEKFHLPYVTLTPTFSICPTHGYLTGEHWTCPKCTIEQPCEVYSRIVGYYRPVQQFNVGKREEFKDRKEFKLT